MTDVFCDWITIYEDHPEGGLPIINDGAVWAVDSDGQVEWRTEKKFTHVGSYDTKIRIMCNGYRVSVDGNIGRFGRADNVFGYSVRDCVLKLNSLLATFGLPPFTFGLGLFNPNEGGIVTTGAIITRVDLTKNYVTGSPRQAARIVSYFAGQDAGRRATVMQYGDSGVSWNEGSKYWYSKLYVKGESLGDHADPQLAEWVTAQGVIRHEISLKSRYLAQNNLRQILDWYHNEGTESMENIVYGRFAEVLERGTAVEHPLEQMPRKLRQLFNDWRTGTDLWHDDSVSDRTRRTWRKQLLPYGIDIKQPSNAVRLATRVEVIKMQALEAPAWYWQQQHRLAA
ncbi:acriflavin resistance protein [Novimethylophilus kurashikiensis]|uniref:Acriflavin resistance protein n=1 Tax=Novimethylophilus kurashikiensis TaxID=1825523 RepID=A0A2R5F5I3_9PROT|nr:phage/plasmid replication protein [Novimethylophilus kurashikiensis]GBG13179.1 acriflavin resistance protein [Novimethylophilus kurashikiensis]